MSSATFIVGIDLGTTNCAMACADPALGPDAPVIDVLVPQLQRPGQVAPGALLPSCLYVPGEHELPAGSARLPWGEPAGPIAGEFARWQGARVPGRLIASAKSWLCHPGVDRSAPILPWGGAADVVKVSPVEATAQLLGHLAAAWNQSHPDAPLGAQEVVITVPASFDAVARALTVTAARQAGLETFTLVEEPQAAFYDFTARHRRSLDRALEGVRLVLVVDVGGGTTDFTLIQAAATSEGPVLKRIAVGDHLMLGGDNMDAALARQVEERWRAGGRKLGAAQWTQLVQAARTAKESLLGPGAPDRCAIALAAEGSRLLAGALSAEITREEAARIVADGFLPLCQPGEPLRRAARTALQELGLPYAQDPAITRHLAAFLQRHAEAGFAAMEEAPQPGRLPRPDAILLNGGVFNSPVLTSRLLDAVSAWWPGAPRVPLLAHESLERAVARGAAYYGLARRGLGRRIGGGTAHAFYVGLAGAAGEPARAVCLIPRGHEEGIPVDLESPSFQLTLGRPVRFPLFSTTSDRVDSPGGVVELTDVFQALPPIHSIFKGAGPKAAVVPVRLRAALTELGTLELWCVSQASDERWRLEFELRGGGSGGPVMAVTESMPARFERARAVVEAVFGAKAGPDSERAARRLAHSLEAVLGPREGWRLPVLRELWSVLYAGARRRRRSSAHERAYYQWLGYCLRPGFGYPLDEWRAEQTFGLFAEGVTFHTEPAVWNEYWILWRRVAGGLSEARQTELWSYVKPFLARRIAPGVPRADKGKGPAPEGFDEMARAAASLEHISPGSKEEFGGWVAERLSNTEHAPGPWPWVLGRLGARAPVHGSGHKTVGAAEAAAWLELLLGRGLGQVDGAAFAAVQLARLTGDRTRDLEEDLRLRTLEALKAAGAPESWQRMATEVAALAADDEARALGDTLPIGLELT